VNRCTVSKQSGAASGQGVGFGECVQVLVSKRSGRRVPVSPRLVAVVELVVHEA